MLIFFLKMICKYCIYYTIIEVAIMLHHGEVKAHAYSDMKIFLASEYAELHVHTMAIVLSTLYK